jgi:choline kinase
MKAVILVAGVGSRLRPLTDNNHKALLPIGSSTTLGHMVSKLHRHGINDFVIITGNMEDRIRAYLTTHFPELNFQYVHNPDYLGTNTGYSLLLAEPHVQGETFIKLDGDVNFDEQIIQRLVEAEEGASYLVIDRSDVDEEVIK